MHAGVDREQAAPGDAVGDRAPGEPGRRELGARDDAVTLLGEPRDAQVPHVAVGLCAA